MKQKWFAVGIILLFVGTCAFLATANGKVYVGSWDGNVYCFGNQSGVKKAFLFGRYTNMSTESNYISLDAVNLRLILFKPFQFLHYVDGQKIIFLKNNSKVLTAPRFIIGIVDVMIFVETITDGTEDVCSINYLTGETSVVTNSTDIEVDNLDIVQVTYTRVGMQAILSLQVNGTIEDRGEFIDPYEEDPDLNFNVVEYGFELSTSREDYSVSYCNKTGHLIIGGTETINLTSSDFSVNGNTLSMFFSLSNADETYTSLTVITTYIKANLSSVENEFLYFSDVAPNPPLKIIEAFGPDNGYVGQIIQFNATIEPLTGLPPYTYHWDFGDGGTSALLNPTHIYTKAEVYTYTFTVIDRTGATASKSGNITILDEP
jgi:hypothetical protein